MTRLDMSQPGLLSVRERELLVRSARPRPREEDASAIERLLSSRIDWRNTFAHARLHSVDALLGRHVQASAPDSVLDEVRETLLLSAHRAQYRHRLFEEGHRRASAIFRDAQVVTLVPKGLPVAQLAYERPWHRPLIDLLYVPEPGRFTDACAALRASGYRALAPAPLERTYRFLCPQRTFVSPPPAPVVVVLSAGLVNTPRPHRVDLDASFSRARAVTIAGEQTLVLDASDRLVYLCEQADSRGHFNCVAIDEFGAEELVFAPWSNNRLIRFTDIHGVATHKPDAVDWDAVMRIASSAAVADAVARSLSISERLFGTTDAPRELVMCRGRCGRGRRVLVRAATGAHNGSLGARAISGAWRSMSQRTQNTLVRTLGALDLAAPSGDVRRLVYVNEGWAQSATRSASIVARVAGALLAEPFHVARRRLLGLQLSSTPFRRNV